MRQTWLILAVAFVSLAGCGSRGPVPVAGSNFSGGAQTHPDQRDFGPPRRVERLSGVHNVLQVSDRIYSGGEPQGEEAFAELAKLGIKTVVSVDGARPAVESARKHGLRYVHIPIGYDGVPTAASSALTRLVRTTEGPIFIHCHHGNHRGPAAAAIACQAEGSADASSASRILETAGTSKNYSGLWRDVTAFTPPADDANLPPLVETADVGSLAAAMARLDRGFDNLKLCRDARWSAPADHPDLVPLREAALVREELREAARNLSQGYDEQFRQWLTRAENLAVELEAALQAGETERASERVKSLEASCQECHAKYRN